MFSRIFPINVNSVWNWFKVKIILISQKHVLKLFKMVPNETVLQVRTEVCRRILGGWEVQTMWNFQKNVMCVEKHVLLKKKKKFTNRLNMGLLLRARIENIVHRVEAYWFSSKENIPCAVISKESHTKSLLRHERIYHYWYPWKRCNNK